jgi:hypothetical protein
MPFNFFEISYRMNQERILLLSDEYISSEMGFYSSQVKSSMNIKINILNNI